MARTSRSESSLAKTSGSSDQNAGPIALPLPGPINVTCATWSLRSMVTDSYGSPMTRPYRGCMPSDLRPGPDSPPADELRAAEGSLGVLQHIVHPISPDDLSRQTPSGDFDSAQLTDHLVETITSIGAAVDADLPPRNADDTVERQIIAVGRPPLDAFHLRRGPRSSGGRPRFAGELHIGSGGEDHHSGAPRERGVRRPRRGWCECIGPRQ